MSNDGHDREAGDLPRRVAHAIRSPLGIVRTALSERDGAPAELRQRLFELAERATGQLELIANRLSLLGRLDAGARPVSTRCDLGVLVRGAVAELEQTRRRPEITVSVEGIDGETPISAEAPMVQRACAELLDNAIRFATARVEVSVTIEDAMARLTVANDGPIADQDRVMAALSRNQPLDSRSGLGIGLWIAATVAERHGGTLTPPTRPDTVFVLRLPMA